MAEQTLPSAAVLLEKLLPACLSVIRLPREAVA